VIQGGLIFAFDGTAAPGMLNAGQIEGRHQRREADYGQGVADAFTRRQTLGRGVCSVLGGR
jgi:hypothetical protein